jgi:LysR family transcriptional regulator, glycine cleavage system transcriptional activator
MDHAPLNALRTFEAVARNGSFKAAAVELCVTQSAVSHQMRILEDWLEIPLFQRTATRPTLLPHAEPLARTLTSTLSEITAACVRVRNTSITQPIVIAAIPSVAICWLIPRLSAFRALHPKIDLRIIYAIHGQDIDFRAVHLAFVFAETTPRFRGAEAEPFFAGDSVAVANPTLVAQMGGIPRPDAMPRWGLLHDTNSTGWRRWLAKSGARFDGELAGPVFEDFNLLRAAALSGQGVALCPAAMIRDDLDAGRLVQLSDTTVMEEFGYYLVTQALNDPAIAPAAQAFRAWALASRGSSGTLA